MKAAKSRRVKWGGRASALLGAVLIAATGLTVAAPAQSASAVSASEFQPGNIISDSNFYNGAAMTEAQIQSFLVSKGSVLANYRSAVSSRSANISDRALPGHVYCSAFQGGSNLLASTLIYRAQVACGISAKVILVTLEKEQGLATRSTAPAGVLNIAMGYGCPDTAACNTTYYGLGNQLYMASLQFKYYQLRQNGYRYQPGAEYVQYHPNASCGGTTINIRNAATAGLYNYTPYQPNAASLNNFPGTGNSCSSYGNRNFFFIYSNWFGSPTTVDGAFAMREAYDAAGGAASDLGTAAHALDCPASRTACWQEFEHGYLAWTTTTGAHVSSGVIGELYLGLGGPAGSLGYPIMGLQPVSANGGGVVQAFQNGLVNAGPAGAFVMKGAIREAHGQLGGVGGPVGWPAAAEVCGLPGGGCSQEFQNGFIYTGSSGVIHTVTTPSILSLYRSLGGAAGSLGYPLMSSQAVSANGGGFAQAFQNGLVNAGPAGAFVMKGEIRAKHAGLGGVGGQMGWPIAAEVCGLPGGGCSQAFQNGTIYSLSDQISWDVAGLVAEEHAAAGGDTGSLGPKVGGLTCSDGDTKCWQEFEHGYITWTKTTGLYVSSGVIGELYLGLGGPAGSLGYPIMGLQPVSANGGGVVQAFQNGLVNAGPAGAFVMKGAIREAHGQLGGVGGPVGWPAAAEVCGLPGGGCSQAFQNGVVVVDGSGVGHAITSSAVLSLYTSLGGAAGSLGYPLMSSQAVSANGGGFAQAFQNGLVNAGPAGAFVMKGEIRAKHAGLGGVGGQMGWPIAAEVCGLPGGGCSQAFQNGTIYSNR